MMHRAMNESTVAANNGATAVLQVRAKGSSMVPFILPNSDLTVERITSSDLCAGDVVCYIDDHAKGVVHRLIRIEDIAGSKHFFVRGDAQTGEEEVPVESLLFKVVRVRYAFLSYNTAGHVGKRIARFSLSENSNALRCKRVLRGAWGVAVSIKKRFFHPMVW